MRRMIGTMGDRLQLVLDEQRAGACVPRWVSSVTAKGGHQYRFACNGVCTSAATPADDALRPHLPVPRRPLHLRGTGCGPAPHGRRSPSSSAPHPSAPPCCSG